MWAPETGLESVSNKGNSQSPSDLSDGTPAALSASLHWGGAGLRRVQAGIVLSSE